LLPTGCDWGMKRCDDRCVDRHTPCHGVCWDESSVHMCGNNMCLSHYQIQVLYRICLFKEARKLKIKLKYSTNSISQILQLRETFSHFFGQFRGHLGVWSVLFQSFIFLPSRKWLIKITSTRYVLVIKEINRYLVDMILINYFRSGLDRFLTVLVHVHLTSIFFFRLGFPQAAMETFEPIGWLYDYIKS
jgi:hypothetical protein